ncbi:MAG: hypothetical protein J3K34DRAFT_412925 [Monoraphidium minutum]|nr:MAG: hypothetical protein J3K34DRAFT_412925 [Monoraphidium minutum]
MSPSPSPPSLPPSPSAAGGASSCICPRAPMEAHAGAWRLAGPAVLAASALARDLGAPPPSAPAALLIQQGSHGCGGCRGRGSCSAAPGAPAPAGHRAPPPSSSVGGWRASPTPGDPCDRVTRAGAAAALERSCRVGVVPPTSSTVRASEGLPRPHGGLSCSALCRRAAP